MANINNAHSDLIHLFIDGEATETERNILFGALKDSPELQEEFSSAMQLKQAFASDIMKLQPPSYLQSQIAERAGLIVAATSTLATAPVLVNSVTTAVSNIAPLAATGISKGLMTLLIGTSVGILSTIGIIQLTKETPKEIAPALVKNVPGTVQMMQPIGSADIGQTPKAELRSEGTVKNNIPNTLRSLATLPSIHFSKAVLNQKSSSVSSESDKGENNVIPNITDADITSQPETVNNNAGNIPQSSEKIAVEQAMKPIAFTNPILPPQNNIGYPSSDTRPLFNGGDGYFTEPDWMARVSLAYRGMPTAKLYQGQTDNAIVPPWNNMGWAAKYEFDPFSAVAVEGGLETFPVYLVNSAGGLTGHHSIGWGGVSYTYSFSLAEVLGIHPEVRALAGMSTAGPIAKLSAGLVFQPAGQFSFSVDPEYTALFIKEEGAVRAGSKLGLTYSVRFHF